MSHTSKVSVWLSFAGLLGFVVLTSLLSVQLWGGKPETLPELGELEMRASMTLQEFGEANGLSDKLLKTVFALSSEEQLRQTLEQSGLPQEEIAAKVTKAVALEVEHATKNWMKIFPKFVLWAVFLLLTFFLLRKGKITPKVRKGLLFAAVVLFGVVLGADPSPMGTVKDAVVLFGKSGAIFPPRMMAFAIMLVGGIWVANKFLCSWGCQVGTLQDLIFRFNRDRKDHKGALPQYKLPFAVTNSIRIASFAVLILGVFVWGLDIAEAIDPFKIYKPALLGVAGILFLAVLFVASLFVYRPWCHLFCPFGLAGWLVEKISIYKINVDYDACTACEACVKACPSKAMEGILKQQHTIPDCFACGTCLETCPVNAVHFESGKRHVPPEGKF